jgi:hypothetical protein
MTATSQNPEFKTLIYRVVLGMIVRISLSTNGHLWHHQTASDVKVTPLFMICRLGLSNGTALGVTILWLAGTFSWVGLRRNTLWRKVCPSTNSPA